MTLCLTPDEFVDLVDGTLAAEREAHLATCAACAATATDVRAALAVAMSAEVPEPSPFFWPSVNLRVHAAVADTARSTWRAWLRWDILVPMAGMAALVMALASAVERGMPLPPEVNGGGGASPLVVERAIADADDEAIALMIDLADSLPDGPFDALGLATLPEMGDAAQALTPDEQRALAALLTSAVDRPTS